MSPVNEATMIATGAINRYRNLPNPTAADVAEMNRAVAAARSAVLNAPTPAPAPAFVPASPIEAAKMRAAEIEAAIKHDRKMNAAQMDELNRLEQTIKSDEQRRDRERREDGKLTPEWRQAAAEWGGSPQLQREHSREIYCHARVAELTGAHQEYQRPVSSKTFSLRGGEMIEV